MGCAWNNIKNSMYDDTVPRKIHIYTVTTTYNMGCAWNNIKNSIYDDTVPRKIHIYTVTTTDNMECAWNNIKTFCNNTRIHFSQIATIFMKWGCRRGVVTSFQLVYLQLRLWR